MKSNWWSKYWGKDNKENEEFTNLNKFAKKITTTVEDADNYYDAYEAVEELLKEFIRLNK